MKKTQLALIFCLVQTLFAVAQQSVAELKQALTTATTDTSRYRLLNDLGKLTELTNRDSALFFYTNYLNLAEKNNAQRDIAWACYRLGSLYSSQYLDHATALKWLEKSTPIAEKLQDHTLLAYDYVSIGDRMSNQRMIDESEKFYEKAERHLEQTNDRQAKLSVYQTIANHYSSGKLDKEGAHAYYLKALSFADESLEDWLSIACYLCMHLSANEKTDSIKILYQQAEQLIKSKKMALNMNTVSSWLVLQGEARKYNLMEKSYKKLLTLVKTPADSALLAECQYYLADYRAQQGNYEGAYDVVVEANGLMDNAELSRYTQNARVQATKTEAAFEIAQKERETVYQKRISLTIGVGLLLALGLTYFVYRSRQQIARQKTELEELNKTKDRLLSIIAHDLRSPIGWLKDSFDLMDNNLQSPEKTARFLSKSKEQVERVYNTMENLLVWALAQRNGLNPRFESVSIAEAVAEQMDNVRDFAERKGILIKNETPPYLTVFADKNQLAIVLNNLLQNALKFTPSGGTIALSVDQTDDKQLTIKIADSGVGMDIEAWQQQQKSQVLLSKEGTAKEKGTGLGLFLVKEIVDKNGGTLAIQSEKGMGTTVSVGLKKGN